MHSIVAIGASAGGLEAFTQLLQSLDDDTGMAFVLVQHLAPKHKSFLPELLAARTKLPVVQVADDMPLGPNRVYVIPPNAHMSIEAGRLRLQPRPEGRTQHMPIDAFMRSAASWAEGHSIAVILSGTASDGAAGLSEIKATGGITFAQEPSTAKYDGMPRAAIATEMVDFVLPPHGIATELTRISRHPLLRDRSRRESESVGPADTHLHRIFVLLRKYTGVDFTHYKTSTLLRRLQRRMLLNKFTGEQQYVEFLEQHPEEVRNLYDELLIHVTSFFRDAESFEALRNRVLTPLLTEKKENSHLRIWVPGCSTGEEVYSLAILVLEMIDEWTPGCTVQIFGTDISENAVQRARLGTYTEGVAADVSPERLRRFFSSSDGVYRVSKAVRDCCVFARQDVTRDPPFSKIDLIVCRNLLIYLNAAMQRKLMHLFQYALKPGGFLMLGSAETVGLQTELFAVVEKSHRIYEKKSAVAHSAAPAYVPTAIPRSNDVPSSRHGPPADAAANFHQQANQVLLSRYSPPGVIVDEEFRVVQFRGQTGAYLEPAPGEASFNLLKLLRDGLLSGTRAALQTARKTGNETRREGLALETNGKTRRVDVVVVPLKLPGDMRHFLVLFEDAPHGALDAGRRHKRVAVRPVRADARRTAHVEKLERELTATREFMQTINQDLEAANEELQSANEEILSNNEELQSANEELDTAKEEMQSTNEELSTVNDELRNRNEEMSRVNSDLVNLLGSVQIAIVIVGANLRIRRFTPMAEKVLNLIPSDIGRPLGDIKPNIDHPDLEKLIAEVVDTVEPRELEVRDRLGKRYSLRIRPYKNLENRIDGAVLSLYDIDVVASAAERVQDALDVAEHVISMVRMPLVVLDEGLRIERVNAAFGAVFGVSADRLAGKPFAALNGGRWDVEELRQRLEAVVTDGSSLDGVKVEVDVPGAGTKRFALKAERVERREGRPPLVFLGFDDAADAR